MASAASSGLGHLDVTDNQKRWLVFGIALNKILIPHVRPFVDQKVNEEYNTLKVSPGIDSQIPTCRLEKWHKWLKYENINGNDGLPRLRGGKYDYSKFNCQVHTHTDFAKLYLESHMVHFNAFDDHLDASAVLLLLGRVPVFPGTVQAAANGVRNERNDWAHCVFSKWNETKFQHSFAEMEDLVKDMALPSADEGKIVAELKDWHNKVPGGDIGELLSSYPEEKPPQLSVTLKKTSDIQVISKDLNDDDHLPIDILLVTVEDCEFLSCLPFLDLHFKSYISEIGYVYFGRMGGNSCREKLKVGLMCCSKGSAIPGGPLPKVQIAMRILQPKAVVSVGICSSLVPEKVKMGDVVIPSKLISAEGSFQVPVSPRFNGVVQDAPYGWVAPLKNQGELEFKVHRDGDVLSQSLTGKPRSDIFKQYPGAVASETECKDVYSAGYLASIEWLVVKGVASYFHQSESATSEWMSFASTMAASVVAKMLNDPRVFLEWPRCSQENRKRRHIELGEMKENRKRAKIGDMKGD